MKELFKLLDKLELNHYLEAEEWQALIGERNEQLAKEVFKRAERIRKEYYDNKVYIRGLIEISNICKNNCNYCGIRKDNKNVTRYRLSKEEIFRSCDVGYELGYRTFVLQGGEDGYYTDDRMCEIISEIKDKYKDCAVTLSLGERSYDSYKRLYDAGADRYLLRHETADCKHYSLLHPKEMSYETRIQCLQNLKKIGYQVGTGFMIGSPKQTVKNIATDMMFMGELKPHMVGMGPFIPHHDTIYANEPAGTVELTVFLIGLVRLLLPTALIPATTALGTIHPKGREMGIKAGANVIMPNLTPVDMRKNYSLYDNKSFMNNEAAECRALIEKQMEDIGYKIITDRGDAYGIK